MFICVLRVINYTCVIPTNHQFIINPTAETLNITNEVSVYWNLIHKCRSVGKLGAYHFCCPTTFSCMPHSGVLLSIPYTWLASSQKVEPGLEQSEAFYSLTYVALFVGHTLSAVAVGLLFNLVPTWYLFLVSTLCHTLGYLLYALATNGWTMILARGLAGAQMGSVDSIAFAYYSISFEKYTENLKTLGRFEEKKSAKVKGYLFSSSTIGYTFGFGLGVGMVFSQLCAFNPLWSISFRFPSYPGSVS